VAIIERRTAAISIHNGTGELRFKSGSSDTTSETSETSESSRSNLLVPMQAGGAAATAGLPDVSHCETAS